jgi:hypothetical protein
VSGSGGNCVLLTRDGIKLGPIGQQDTWVWGVAAKPESSFVVTRKKGEEKQKLFIKFLGTWLQ